MEPSTFQCDPQKLDALQIDPRYKQALSQFCADPKNASACEMLCETPPEMIEEKIGEIEEQLQLWQQEGLPPEMADGLQAGFEQAVDSGDMPPMDVDTGISMAQAAGRNPEEIQAKVGAFEEELSFADGGMPSVNNSMRTPGTRLVLDAMSFANGGSPRARGLAGIKTNVKTPFSQQMPKRLQKPQGTGNPFQKQKQQRPPVRQKRKQGNFGDGFQVMAAKGEMVVPNDVLNQKEGEVRKGLEALMERGGYNPDRFEVGNPLMKKDREGRRAAFSIGGVLGGVVGFALGGPAGAALGAGAGTFVETGDVKESLMMGLGAYGLAGAGVGMGWWGDKATAGFGEGLFSYWSDPGSQALEGLLASDAPATAVASGKPSIPSGTDTLNKVAAVGSGGAPAPPVPSQGSISSELAGSENIASAMTGGKGLDGLTDKALKYGMLGSLAYGMVEPEPIAATPTGESYMAEYDAYVECVNSGSGGCEKPATLMTAGSPYAGIGTTGAGSPFNPIPVSAAAGGFVPYGEEEGMDDVDAKLGLNEFVFTADAVRGAGNGDVIQGAYNLYDLMDVLEGAS